MPEMKAVPCSLRRATMGEVRPGFPQVISEIEQVLGIPLISHDKASDLTPMRFGIAVCSVHEESIVKGEISVHLLPPLPDERKVGFEAVELSFHLREQVPRSRSNSELVQFLLTLAMFCLPGREELWSRDKVLAQGARGRTAVLGFDTVIMAAL